MKITLDISKLLEEGEITKEEYEKIIRLSSKDSNAFGINILVAFGVVAVTVAVVAYKPSIFAGTALALICLAIGFAVLSKYYEQWRLLGNILLLIGALGSAVSLVRFFEGETNVFFLIAIIFLIIGMIARSGLLVALAALAIAPIINTGTAYGHGGYFLFVKRPILEIGVFGTSSVIAYLLSRKLPAHYERLAIIFSRTSLIMVNLGFWVGSLWGDDFIESKFNDEIFAIGWAIALVATGIWAIKRDKRFVVNVVASFGAIHFYTQWFERLETTPASVLLAGIIAILISLGLWKYNQRNKRSGNSAILAQN